MTGSEQPDIQYVAVHPQEGPPPTLGTATV